jgi:excisionase family DNA binding protein
MHAAPSVETPLTEFLTAQDVARLLKVSSKTIYRFAWSGGLPAVRISRKCLRFRRAELEEWLRGRSLR